jgi:hypothetical protein
LTFRHLSALAIRVSILGNQASQRILVCDPSLDHGCRSLVIAQSLDQDLPTSGELTAKDAMRSMSLVERPARILDVGAEVIGGVLVFETLDAIAVRPGEQEADHRVIEASIDEIINDRTELGLSTELFK